MCGANAERQNTRRDGPSFSVLSCRAAPSGVRVDAMEDFSDLIRRCKAGERAALDALCRRHGPTVERHASGLLGRQLRRIEETMSVANEVWIEVLRRLPEFQDCGEDKFRVWLRKITESCVRGRGRRVRGRDGVTWVRNAESGQVEGARERVRGPATDAGAADELQRLERCMARLPPEQQRVLRLATEHELSMQRIADVMGWPSADAARKRRVRALIALRREWKIDSNPR